MSVLKIKKPDGTWEIIGSNNSIEVDTTLTQSGKPADAKTVGDYIGNLTDLETITKTNLVSAINEVKNNSNSANGDSVIKVIPKVIYNGSGILSDMNLVSEKTTNYFGMLMPIDFPYINANKDYLITYNETEYLVKSIALPTFANNYIGNIMIFIDREFSTRDSYEQMSSILPFLIMSSAAELGVKIDTNTYKDLPFVIIPDENNNMLFLVNNGEAEYNLTITELNIEIEDPINKYLQADYNQLNKKHPGFIKNKIIGIEPLDLTIFNNVVGDLSFSTIDGPDDAPVYVANLGSVSYLDFMSALFQAIDINEPDTFLEKNLHCIIKLYETYELLYQRDQNNDELYFGNLYLIDSSAEDTKENFLIIARMVEVDTSIDPSGMCLQAMIYTTLNLDPSAPLEVGTALNKIIPKTFLPEISTSDIPYDCVNYKNSYPHYILRDSENNYEYVLISRNGNLLSYCRCKSIAITTPPTKTNYKYGEVFNPTGMIVTATRQDDTTEQVTNYTYPTYTLTNTSQTSITISYTEAGRTYFTTTPITVTN